jgi:hypothetical protein
MSTFVKKDLSKLNSITPKTGSKSLVKIGNQMPFFTMDLETVKLEGCATDNQKTAVITLYKANKTRLFMSFLDIDNMVIWKKLFKTLVRRANSKKKYYLLS